MEKVFFLQKPTLEEYYQSDGEARSYAADLIRL
jgi:1-deoxy-D-xylulose-5-phosphate reductoisomerase